MTERTETLINHVSSSPEISLQYLKDCAKRHGLGVVKVCQPLFKIPGFSYWSGSSKRFQHHYGTGGLVRHTAEVVALCFKVCNFYSERYEVDATELFLAALFHDAGKLYDYEGIQPIPMIPNYNWVGTPHKRLIHHVSRSAIMWSEMARRDKGVFSKYHEPVLHAILSHHGFREAGSPVAPKTRVAWLVHLCDGISARMCDADTLDIVTGQESKY